jgi:hypothetical protein
MPTTSNVGQVANHLLTSSSSTSSAPSMLLSINYWRRTLHPTLATVIELSVEEAHRSWTPTDHEDNIEQLTGCLLNEGRVKRLRGWFTTWIPTLQAVEIALIHHERENVPTSFWPRTEVLELIKVALNIDAEWLEVRMFSTMFCSAIRYVVDYTMSEAETLYFIENGLELVLSRCFDGLHVQC